MSDRYFEVFLFYHVAVLKDNAIPENTTSGWSVTSTIVTTSGPYSIFSNPVAVAGLLISRTHALRFISSPKCFMFKFLLFFPIRLRSTPNVVHILACLCRRQRHSTNFDIAVASLMLMPFPSMHF